MQIRATASDDGWTVLTGATSGIGREVALGLAAEGRRLILPVRSPARGRRLLSRLRGRAHLVACDLSSLDSVRSAAEEILARAGAIDLLIHDAGRITRRRSLSADGHELTLAVNHLGPFLLTRLLQERMVAGGRIVVVGSTAHSRGRFDFEDMEMVHGYSWWRAYARSKLANLLFTFALDRRLRGAGVRADCVHPGVVRTNLPAGWSPALAWAWRLLSPFFRSAREGAAPVLQATLSTGGGGRYFYRFQEARPAAAALDEDLQERLWRWSEAAVERSRRPTA